MSTDSQSLAQAVAAEVRAEMARQRRTGVELAGLLGLTQPTVSRRLSGQTAFDLNEVERICEWLGVDPGMLLPRREARAS